MKKTFDSIDIAKFIASIFLFSVHCGVFSDYQYASITLEILARWCVPFFFICSAFFLFEKSRDGQLDKATFRRYIQRILSLFLLWLIINIPDVIYMHFYYQELSSFTTLVFIMKNIFLSAAYMGSWYMTSSIFSAILVYFLCKKYQTKTVLLITFPFFLMCVFSSVYYGLMPPRVALISAFLCFPLNLFNGCFYFSIGKYLSENKKKLLDILPRWKCFFFFLLFYTLYIMELFIAKRSGILRLTDVAFSVPAFSVFLFLFCIQSAVHIRNAALLRKLSIIIYCCQGNVLIANMLCKQYLGFSSIISYLLSAVIVAIICLLVLILQKRNTWKWTAYLT